MVSGFERIIRLKVCYALAGHRGHLPFLGNHYKSPTTKRSPAAGVNRSRYLSSASRYL